MLEVIDADDCAVTVLVDGEPYNGNETPLTGRVINFPSRKLAATWLNRLELLKGLQQKPD